MNHCLMKDLLAKQKLFCNEAGSGEIALEMIHKRCELVKKEEAEMYKIIFLDYSMQGMNGPEVAIQIARIVQDANLEQPTICCCSAY